jgi:hypothetical protein
MDAGSDTSHFLSLRATHHAMRRRGHCRIFSSVLRDRHREYKRAQLLAEARRRSV